MSLVRAIFVTVRPRQQVKNAIVFTPLVFAGLADDLTAVAAATVAFFSFCFASGSVYIVNDLLDRDTDKHHPRKRTRPAAQGTLPPHIGYSTALLFAFGSFILAWLISPFTTLSVVTYVILVSLYSIWLKHQPVLDVITIALGFVIRVVGGIAAIGAIISPWIIAVTFFGAWHIASTKREAEHSALKGSELGVTRTVLKKYSSGFLRTMSNYTAMATIILYTLYAALVVHNPLFLATSVPFTYVMCRYIWLVRTYNADDPTDVLLFDNRIRIAALVYFGLTIALLY